MVSYYGLAGLGFRVFRVFRVEPMLLIGHTSYKNWKPKKGLG